jgi:hypothetical protein
MMSYPQRKTALIGDVGASRGWEFALRAAASIGGYRDVVFADSRVHAGVAACGGWVALCRSESLQHAVLRRRFLQGYRRVARGDVVACPAVLCGDHHRPGAVPVVLRNGETPPLSRNHNRCAVFSPNDNKSSYIK